MALYLRIKKSLDRVLTDEELDIYHKVGKLVAEVREEMRPLVKPGEMLLTIAEAVEEAIKEKGAKLAFPCNISLNEIAAHYSPPAYDERRIEEGDIVKVDIGAHLDGYIADTAFTFATGGGREMVQVVERALERAIAVVKPGVDIGDIGAVIEEEAIAAGFKPIRNLTGHGLGRWNLHAGLAVPNVKERTGERLEVGDVMALEPFLTDGAGFVEDKPQVFIFRYLRDRPVRMRMTRELLAEIKRSYATLPFAERWLAKGRSRVRLELTLRDLVGAGVLHPYYVLAERAGGKVVQAEHTVIVTEEGCEVITR